MSITPEDEARIAEAIAARDAAEKHLRETVVDVTSRSSVRVVAERFSFSTATIQRWKGD